jgi:hypothetical protein
MIWATKRWQSLLLLGSVFALLPTLANASPIIVEFNFDLNYFNLRFGSAVNNAWVDEEFSDPRDVTSWDPDAGVLANFDIVGGSMNLITGSLLSITPDGTDAVYTYDGGGSVFLTFDLLLPSGEIQSGTFAAPLGPLTIWGSSVDGQIGPGVFDEATAKLLGIYRYTIGGNVPRYTDVYDQYPDPYRMVQWFGELDVVGEVPEPSESLLLGIGGMGLWFATRRRFRSLTSNRREASQRV